MRGKNCFKYVERDREWCRHMNCNHQGKHKWRGSQPSTTRLSADRLSFFLQQSISMPMYYFNIKYCFISVFINVYLYRLALSS